MLFEKPVFYFVLWWFYFFFFLFIASISSTFLPLYQKRQQNDGGKGVFNSVPLVWPRHLQFKQAKFAAMRLLKMQHRMARQNIRYGDGFQQQTEILSGAFFFFFKGYKTLSLFPVLTPVRGCQEARCPGNRCNEPGCFPPGRRAAPRGLAPHGHLRALSALLLV